MANYPDPIGRRLPYAVDGTVGFYYKASLSGGAVQQFTQAQMNQLSSILGTSEVFAGAESGLLAYGFIFPYKVDIIGWYWQWTNFFVKYADAFETSADTTNGQDGTWTPFYAGGTTGPYYYGIDPIGGSHIPTYRTYVQQNGPLPPASVNNLYTGYNVGWFPLTNVHAIRFRWNLGTNQYHGVETLHLYGDYSAGQSVDALELWDPTTNQILAPGGLNFADIGRGGGPYYRQFRVKNVSSSRTANSITVSLGVPVSGDDSSPSLFTYVSLSTDGGLTSGPTITIPSLAPGAISPTYTVVNNPPSTASVGLWSWYVKATAASWS